MMRNDYIGELITNDVNSLAHYGKKGMKRGVWGGPGIRYQNQAVYARGNPRYKRQPKNQESESKTNNEIPKEEAKKMIKSLRTASLSRSPLTGGGLKTAKQSRNTYLNNRAKYANAVSAYDNAKQNGASKEELKSLRRDLRNARRDAIGSGNVYFQTGTGLLRNPTKAFVQSRIGENAALLDLGLEKGWGHIHRGLIKADYVIQNPEKTNQKLNNFIQKYRNSTFNRAILGDYTRLANRSFYEAAYDRVIDSAFKNYGLTPTRTINRSVNAS